MEIESINASELNTFLRCPRQWKFERDGSMGVKIEERKALYGKAIHNCLVIYFDKISDKPSSEEIEATAKKAFEEGTTYAMKGFKSKTNRILSNFVDFEKKRARSWRQYRPTFVEKWMEAKIWSDFPPIRGIIDFYSQGDATVIDWKTGSGEMDDDNLRQGKLYEMILKSNGYPVKKVIFCGLSTGTLLPVPRVTDGWIRKVGSSMIEMARMERFPAKPSGLCGWCPHILACQLEKVCLWWRM